MNFLIGKEQDFYDFLDGINKKDKVAIISHIDLDGIVSAVFLNEILKTKKLKPAILKFINYGAGMFEKIYREFKKKKITKVFLSDINESADLENFKKMQNEFGVFLIDHHPSEDKNSVNVIRARSEDCAGWILYNLAKNLTDFEKWNELVCATLISDYCYKDETNFNFIKQNFPDAKQENIFESEPGKLAAKINAGITYFKGKEKKIFDLILKNKIKKLDKYVKIVDKEIQNLIGEFKKEREFYPEKNLYFYYCFPKLSVTSTAASILSVQEPDKIFVLVSDIKEEPEFVKVTSRTQNEAVSLNLMMKKGVEGLESSSAGGHNKASAARFLKKDLEKFKENILSYKIP